MLDFKTRASIADATFSAGGGTFSAATGEPYTGRTGYAVELPGGTVYSPTLVSAAAVMLGVRTVESRHPGAEYIGTWLDTDGTLYVGPVVILDSREDAVRLGRALGERAIFDFATGESIYLDSAA